MQTTMPAELFKPTANESFFVSPYERFQLEKYGDILQIDDAFKSHLPEEENCYVATEDRERMAEAYFEAQLNEFQSY